MEREGNPSMTWPLLAALLLGLPPLVYVVGYFATVQQHTGRLNISTTYGAWDPCYPALDSLPIEADTIFGPMHWMDKTWIRPAYWKIRLQLCVDGPGSFALPDALNQDD
jgi:hypothetical protein